MAEVEAHQERTPGREPAQPAAARPASAELAGAINPMLAQQQTIGNQAVQRQIRTGTVPPGVILGQQGTLGNQAVQRLLRARALQTRLTVTAPDDQYEQEADRVAGQVTATPPPVPAPVVQRGHEEELVGRQWARMRQGAEGGVPQRQSSNRSEIVQRTTALQRKKGNSGSQRYGSFDVAGATYTLLPGSGCKIHVSFKPGKDIPRGTKISFIQAIRTTIDRQDGKTDRANAMPGQAEDPGHARIDQFLGNPSPFYLDYIDESLLQLAAWAKLPKSTLGFDVRDYEAYREMAMPPIDQKKFDVFWAYHDTGELAKLSYVQKDTGQKNIKQKEGKRASKPTGFFGFIADFFAKDTEAVMYDEPKDNIQKPAKDGEKSTCLFHTAAVTKQIGGDATVWDMIEWGYTIENRKGTLHWELVPMRHLGLSDSMMKGALKAMIESTPAYSGPTGLKSSAG